MGLGDEMITLSAHSERSERSELSELSERQRPPHPRHPPKPKPASTAKHVKRQGRREEGKKIMGFWRRNVNLEIQGCQIEENYAFQAFPFEI